MKKYIFISIFSLFPIAGCYVNETPQDARYANPPAQNEGAYEQEADGKNGEVPPPAPGTSEGEYGGNGPVDPGPNW